jgi:hypothetical protein
MRQSLTSLIATMLVCLPLTSHAAGNQDIKHLEKTNASLTNNQVRLLNSEGSSDIKLAQGINCQAVEQFGRISHNKLDQQYLTNLLIIPFQQILLHQFG